VTRIGVQAAPGRVRLNLAAGPLSPRVISCSATGARVALVATTALLLGGDHIEIDIDVGPGAWLEIVEIAGTVAYDAGDIASSWTVRARVADCGALIWAAEPFVVAGGANTLRSTVIDLGARAVAYVRETVVLGRTGEAGGAVRSRLTVNQHGSPILVEDMDLRDPGTRSLPGILGTARVIDTVGLFGARAPADSAVPAGCRFELDLPGTVARALTSQVDRSPLSSVARAWQSVAKAAGVSTEGCQNATAPNDPRRVMIGPQV
jgi:urease accessory protein